jgi:hypothetical protein
MNGHGWIGNPHDARVNLAPTRRARQVEKGCEAIVTLGKEREAAFGSCSISEEDKFSPSSYVRLKKSFFRIADFFVPKRMLTDSNIILLVWLQLER